MHVAKSRGVLLAFEISDYSQGECVIVIHLLLLLGFFLSAVRHSAADSLHSHVFGTCWVSELLLVSIINQI